MNIKTCAVVTLLLLSQVKLYAQTTAVKPLNVGDTLSPALLGKALSHSTIPVQPLAGKALVLDFWATWCGACLKAFPGLQSLQNAFNGQLQVVLVNAASTGDEANSIQTTLQALEKRTGNSISLPVLVKDTVLAASFPYTLLPQSIWIDSNHVVKAITTAEEATPGNIQKLLNGEPLDVIAKKDVLDFDKSKPLFTDGNATAGNALLYRSTITRYIEGIGAFAGKTVTEDGELTRFYMLNRPLASLYTTAFGITTPPNRTFYNISNRHLLEADEKDTNRLYCYEIITPPSDRQKLLALMQDDLERSFGIYVKKKQRQLKILQLTGVKNPAKLYTTGGNAAWETEEHTLHKYLHNIDMASFTDLLNTISSIPVVDSTAITANIDIQLPNNISQLNTEDLIKWLTNEGFVLKPATAMMEVTTFFSN